MNRTDRLMGILLELQARGELRAEDLAGTFEVSVRTIYRDVEALCETGVPVVATPGKGYRLMEGYFLPPLTFTADEAALLILGGELVRDRVDPLLRQAAEAALRKLAGRAAGRAPRRDGASPAGPVLRFGGRAGRRPSPGAGASRDRGAPGRAAALPRPSPRAAGPARRRADPPGPLQRCVVPGRLLSPASGCPAVSPGPDRPAGGARRAVHAGARHAARRAVRARRWQYPEARVRFDAGCCAGSASVSRSPAARGAQTPMARSSSTPCATSRSC